MEQATILHLYNQIHANLTALATTNRLIISRMTTTDVTTSPALAQHLIEIYRCNMRQCEVYNLQINHLLETLRAGATMSSAAAAVAAAPAPLVPQPSESRQLVPPISINTTFFRRTADGRDIPISQEEYMRLSANGVPHVGAGGAATPSPPDPFTMLNLLANAINTMSDRDDDGATEEEITRATRNTTFGEIENPCSTTCPITHEDFAPNSEVAVINHCGHIFMRRDLAQWLGRDSRCPMCRHDIRVRSSSSSSSSDNNGPNMENLLSALGLNTGDNITVRTFHTRRSGGL